MQGAKWDLIHIPSRGQAKEVMYRYATRNSSRKRKGGRRDTHDSKYKGEMMSDSKVKIK